MQGTGRWREGEIRMEGGWTDAGQRTAIIGQSDIITVGLAALFWKSLWSKPAQTPACDTAGAHALVGSENHR